MSERKPYLSRKFPAPFDFECLTDQAKRDIERELSFITGARLAAIMEHIGQDRFVHVSGRSWKQVSRYLKGDRAATEVLQAIAAETSTSIDWLAQGKLRTAGDARYERKLLESVAGQRLLRLTRERPEPEWSSLGYALFLIDQRLHALDAFVPGAATPGENESDVVEAAQSDFIRLPVFLDVMASAGPGAVPASQHAEGTIGFDRQFLRELGAAPDRCSIIRATGDSMQPSIPDGSLLIVDHGQSEVKNGHIMVINLGDDLLVKRVRRRLDGLIDLVSDNIAYPPETIGHDMLHQLRVVGRVVYFCRTP